MSENINISINPLREHLILATIGAGATCFIGFLPVILGAITDYLHLSADKVGFISMCNFIGIAVGALLSPMLMRCFRLKACFVFSLVLLALAEYISAFIVETYSLAMIRFFSGVSAGLVSGLIAAAITLFTRKERGFSFYMVGMFTISGVGLYVLPGYIAKTGIKEMFMVFAALPLLSILLLPFLRVSVTNGLADKQLGTQGESRNTKLNFTSFVCLSIILFLMTGIGGLWAFIERVGVDSGFATDKVAFILAVSAIFGACGFLVESSERRFGAVNSVLFGTFAMLVSALLLSEFAYLYPVYSFAVCLVCGAWAFTVPMTQSLLTKNGSKNLAALSMLMYWSGLAAGTFIHGRILNATNDFQITLWSCAGFYALSMFSALLIIRSSSTERS